MPCSMFLAVAVCLKWLRCGVHAASGAWCQIALMDLPDHSSMYSSAIETLSQMGRHLRIRAGWVADNLQAPSHGRAPLWQTTCGWLSRRHERSFTARL